MQGQYYGPNKLLLWDSGPFALPESFDRSSCGIYLDLNLNQDFGAYVCTIMVRGPFWGRASGFVASPDSSDDRFPKISRRNALVKRAP